MQKDSKFMQTVGPQGGWSIIFHFSSESDTTTSFWKVQYGKGGEKSKFIVEKPDKHSLSQAIKAPSIIDKSCSLSAPLL